METENFKHLYNVLNNEIKRIEPMYDRQADYQTNSKSYYDYLAKLKKLFELLSNRIWEYDDELKKRFEEWDKLIEKFPENVEKLLVEWLKDGTLEEIINVNIFEDLNNKIDEYKNELNNKIENNTKELNEKIENLEKELNKLINESIENLSNLINLINKKLNHFIVNVEEFEGSDTERIQKALNKVNEFGGGVVYVPKHDYEIEETIIISKNTTLYSEIGTRYLRVNSGYMLINGNKNDTFDEYQGNGNIKIINGEFDGQAQNDIIQGSNIVMAHGKNIMFDNVTFSNANSHSLEINACKDVIVTNCKFLGQLESMTSVEALQIDMAIENAWNGFGKNDKTTCKNITVTNCIFDKSDVLPTISRGVGTHSARMGAYHDKIIIENNDFNQCRDWSIMFIGWKNSTIKNNRFNNGVGGIIMYGADVDVPDIYDEITGGSHGIKNVTISDNSFENIKTKQVIYSYGRENSKNENINITNNFINNCINSNGMILLFHTNFGKAVNNNINNFSGFGIHISDVSKINIDENIITNSNGSHGIRCEKTSNNVTISNNLLEKIDGNGVNCLNDCVNFIVSNNVFSGMNGNGEDYDAIYMHNGPRYINISNNIFKVLSGYTYESAIYCSNTVTNGIRVGNLSVQGQNEEKYRCGNIIDKGDL